MYDTVIIIIGVSIDAGATSDSQNIAVGSSRVRGHFVMSVDEIMFTDSVELTL